ncbi:nucleotidyltransferase [Salibacterium salarium]|uniref:tRNA(Met) cytidine acetate ligase n=1 Tax=Salibacterium salarium TaxID=284579 RepID=A0A428MU07_9BACI|nr:nucleotidyltransferase [Salibacterium salarium]RSL29610.1 nucleotidyltransferase [Salibacterium salarium]
MKTVGLIVEYNPFHNGHYYHIEAAKEATNADAVVCVMSGYFLQRGEPALLPRRNRTMMALQGGADLVVELPYIFSSQHASWFAQGAISILDHLGVDTICFGSEHGEITPFLKLVDFLETQNQPYNEYIKAFSKQGYSYPKAASLAFSKLEPDKDWPDLSQPNNILGYHYIRAVNDLNSSMTPATIKRAKAHYHDQQLSGYSIASATSIRRSLIEQHQSPDSIREAVPFSTYQSLSHFFKYEGSFYNWEQYFEFLQSKTLTLSSAFLSEIYEAEEGLHHRFQSMIKTHTTFHSFMEALKTKRYTWTRLQRFAVQVLTGTLKSEATEAIQSKHADHIRILGMNQTGQAYLNLIKKHMELPVFSTLPKHKTPQQQLDEKAAMAYYIPLTPEDRKIKWKQEYEQPPIILD